MVCQSKVFSNVIVGITTFPRSFVCFQSVSSLTDASGLAVGAIDLLKCPLSVARFVPILKVGQ